MSVACARGWACCCCSAWHDVRCRAAAAARHPLSRRDGGHLRVEVARLRRRQCVGAFRQGRRRQRRSCWSSISPTLPATLRRRASCRRRCPMTTRSRSGCAAEAGRNNFEVKFVDASGDNVWWFRRAEYQFSGDWQQVRIKRRQIEFAWGPTTDRRCAQFQSIEFVLSAGDEGGQRQLVVRSLVAEAVAPATRRRAADCARIVRGKRQRRGARHRRQDEHDVAKRANRRCAADVRDRSESRARVRRHRDRLGSRAACAALFDRDVARRQRGRRCAASTRATAAATRI